MISSSRALLLGTLLLCAGCSLLVEQDVALPATHPASPQGQEAMPLPVSLLAAESVMDTAK